MNSGNADALGKSGHGTPSPSLPTPGPWTTFSQEQRKHYDETETFRAWYVQHGAATICSMNSPCLLYDNAAADARLIAAAPDLLAALERLTHEVLAITDQSDAGRLDAIERLHKHGEAIENARDAIAKATERGA